jgi:hypothetical protein
MKIRALLEKPAEVRNRVDIDELAGLIKGNKFFKERGELVYNDVTELAKNF